MAGRRYFGPSLDTRALNSRAEGIPLPIRRLLAAVLLSAAAIQAAPPLTTIRDTVFKADGSRFDGYVIIEWRSFDASDTSFIGRNRIQLRVTDGFLNARLVPTTTAAGSAYYSVRYVANGSIQFSEFWAVPASAALVRVRDIRIPDPLLGPAQSGAVTAIEITDVDGLRNELDTRPVKSVTFAHPRAAIINDDGAIESAAGNPADCVRVDGSSGPCGGAATAVTGTFVDGETPSGSVNGSNVAYVLSQAPNPASSLLMYRNGILQKRFLDYDLTGATVTFSAPSTPQPGDVLLASYRTAGTGGTLPQVVCTNAGAATGGTGSTMLGSCSIPAGLLRPGDRLELLFDYTHEGSATGWQADVRFGAALVVSRTAAAGSAMLSGRASLGFHASGAQWSSQTWGQAAALDSGVGAAAENLAAPITVEFRGNLGSASAETVTLRNYSVVRYPAP